MAMVGRWLVKTEPEEWSWEHQQANGGVSQWDGVRNAQAQKHMRAMAEGDLCFFYHSGPKAKEIVGIARVCKTFYPDPSDSSSKHGMVDIEAVSKLDQPLSLARLKQDDRLHSFILFRQTRLSVVPVSISEWDVICELAGQLEPPSSLDNGVVSSKASRKAENGVAMARPLSSDDNGGVRIRVKKQVSNGGARSRVLSSDENGTVNVTVNAPDLELCDGETRVSLAHMTEEGKSRVRVFVQALEACDNEARARRSNMVDKPSWPPRVRIRERGKPFTVKACIDGIDMAFDAEVSKPPNRIDEEVKGEGGSCDILHTDFTMEVSRTMDLAADTKKVYSRRIKKERQLDSLSPNAEVTDSGVVVSDPGRVYKRRHRKQRSVDSLSR